MHVQDIAVSDLSVHPALARMARWEQDDPRFLALVDDVRDRGIDVPLIIDPEHRIVDGRHRYFAAKRLQLTTVPVQTVQADQVTSIMLSTILQRRHYSPGQRAYITYPFFEAAHEESRLRSLNNLRQGNNIPSRAIRTIADFVADLGISRDLFNQAAKVHQIFADDPCYSADMEPRILDEHSPVGLGAVIAGYVGYGTTFKKVKGDLTQKRQLELFTQTVTDELQRWRYWSAFDESAQSEHWRSVRKAISALDPSTCESLAGYHKRMAKEFIAAATMKCRV